MKTILTSESIIYPYRLKTDALFKNLLFEDPISKCTLGMLVKISVSCRLGILEIFNFIFLKTRSLLKFCLQQVFSVDTLKIANF